MSNESAIIFKLDASQIETEAANTERSLKALDSAGIKTGKTVEGLETKTKKGGKQLKNYDRELSKTEKAMKSLNGVAGKLATGIAAIGLGAAIKSSVDYAAQVDILSEKLGINTEQLSRNAYATKRYGVDLDGLSDIYKDMSDRVGDFLQSGGGPMVDFFENIAPQVGVTAEQFRKLNGADALQLYVNSLERANLSQNEMTFYMEAIASESTTLLPLLRNNGQLMKTLGDEAERTGNVVDKEFASGARAGKNEIKEFNDQTTGLVNNLASSLLPAFTSAGSLLNDNYDLLVNVTIAAAGLTVATKGLTVAQAAFNRVANLNPLIRIGTILAVAAGGIYTFIQRQNDAKTATEKLKDEVEELRTSLAGLNKDQVTSKKSALQARLEADQKAVEKIRERLKDVEGNYGAGNTGRAQFNTGQVTETLNKQLEATEKRMAATSEQIGLLDSQLEKLNKTQDGTSKGSKNLTDQITEAGKAYQSLREQFEPLAVAAENYKHQQAQIQQLHEAGKISDSDKNAALSQLRKNYNSVKLEIRGVRTETEQLASLEEKLSATRFNVLDTSPKTPEGQTFTQPNRSQYKGATGQVQYGLDSAGVTAANQQSQVDAERDSALGAVRQTEGLDLHQRLAYEREIRQQHAEETARIEQEKEDRIAEINQNAGVARLEDSAKLFGSLASMSATFAGDSSAITQGLVAFQKAASISKSIIAIQTGIAQASALPFPANLGAMATVAASTAGIVSTIAGTQSPAAPTFSASNYSGEYDKGGSIDAGKWGIVGEVGPEIVRGPAQVTGRKETAKMMNGGGNRDINIPVSITVQAQPGMSDREAANQGRAMGESFDARIRKTVMDMTRPGGELYGR
ncbi:hypothetical protein [Marinobacter salarius]|uniref:hypothetical protein n=2 Tax=Gammaproteobacteria TaxID=1236 RepID=UPI003BAC5795